MMKVYLNKVCKDWNKAKFFKCTDINTRQEGTQKNLGDSNTLKEQNNFLAAASTGDI
jgi:hypothetical protein